MKTIIMGNILTPKEVVFYIRYYKDILDKIKISKIRSSLYTFNLTAYLYSRMLNIKTSGGCYEESNTMSRPQG